jgi:hypothetical protein
MALPSGNQFQAKSTGCWKVSRKRRTYSSSEFRAVWVT